MGAYSDEPIFDVQDIRRRIDEEEWHSEDTFTEERTVYLGTVFALMPSGKYYTPWANSNVTEDEASEDEKWREQVDEELESVGLHLISGEGDPCDLFAAEWRDKEDVDEV